CHTTAVAAYSKLGYASTAPDLLDLLAKGDTSDSPALKEAFMTMHGEEMPALLVAALPQASPENKVVLIEVLAHRAYPGSFQAINSLLTDNDANVKKAAFAALPAVSRSNDLPVLIALMNTNGDEKSVQKAIANVVEFSANQDQDIESVLSHYKTQNDQQKIKY